jgi:hypothetical protein
MGGEFRTKRTHGRWGIFLALLCVLLVAVAGTIQVAHTHADGIDTHADCSLCAAAHVTVQVVQSPDPAPTVSVVAVLEALPVTFAPSALSTFALFTRPPPSVDIVPA